MPNTRRPRSWSPAAPTSSGSSCRSADRTSSTSFLGEFVTGLGEGLVSRGVDLILATAAMPQSELSVLRHVVESGRADGVVVTRIAETDERVAYLRARDFPFVAHGRLLDDTQSYNWIDTDGGARLQRSLRHAL